jgi:hypothetical protein
MDIQKIKNEMLSKWQRDLFVWINVWINKFVLNYNAFLRICKGEDNPRQNENYEQNFDYKRDYSKLLHVLNSVDKEVQIDTAVQYVESFCRKHGVNRNDSIVQEIRMTEDYVHEKILAKQVNRNYGN